MRSVGQGSHGCRVGGRTVERCTGSRAGRSRTRCCSGSSNERTEPEARGHPGSAPEGTGEDRPVGGRSEGRPGRHRGARSEHRRYGETGPYRHQRLGLRRGAIGRAARRARPVDQRPQSQTGGIERDGDRPADAAGRIRQPACQSLQVGWKDRLSGGVPRASVVVSDGEPHRPALRDRRSGQHAACPDPRSQSEDRHSEAGSRATTGAGRVAQGPAGRCHRGASGESRRQAGSPR